MFTVKKEQNFDSMSGFTCFTDVIRFSGLLLKELPKVFRLPDSAFYEIYYSLTKMSKNCIYNQVILETVAAYPRPEASLQLPIPFQR